MNPFYFKIPEKQLDKFNIWLTEKCKPYNEFMWVLIERNEVLNLESIYWEYRHQTYKKKNMYILSGSKGTWDSYYSFIVGVFDSIELAQAEKKRIIEELELLSKKYSKEEIVRLKKIIRDRMNLDELEDDDLEEPEEIKEFKEWPFQSSMDCINMESFQITEYQLNSRHIKIEEL